MKVQFEYNDEIVATADLEKLLNEDESVKIYGKDYKVWDTYHDVEIDEFGVHEKFICTLTDLNA